MSKEMIKKSSRDWGIIQKKNKATGKLEWYARIIRTDGSGKRKEYTAKAESKSQARRLREELSDNFKQRGELSIEGNKLIFRELAVIYSEKKLFNAVYHGEGKVKRKVGGVRSLNGSLHYLEVLKGHFGAKLIRQITHNDIEEFKAIRLKTPTSRGERSIADTNRALELLRAVLRFAARQGWLAHSPFEMGSPLISKADETRRERVLSYEEEIRLLSACNGRRSHLKPIIITALDSSMRRGEILKLQWKDIDFLSKTITVIAMNSKTARARNIGMTQRVFVELSQLWEKSPKDLNELVFGIKDTVKTSFASACKDATIEDLRFHDLRHTAISRMVQAGLAPMEIMKISGHTQMNTFARYVNPDTNAVQRIADRLSAFNTEATNEISIASELSN